MKLFYKFDDSFWKDIYLSCACLNWWLLIVSVLYYHIVFILITSFLLCLFIKLYAILALQTFMDAFSNKMSNDKEPSNEESYQHDILNIVVQRC